MSTHEIVDETLRQIDITHVTIPRVQHEALMAAAKALQQVRDDDSGEEDWGVANRALAALRAAGIQIEGE